MATRASTRLLCRLGRFDLRTEEAAGAWWERLVFVPEQGAETTVWQSAAAAGDAAQAAAYHVRLAGALFEALRPAEAASEAAIGVLAAAILAAVAPPGEA
jgi:hypothetical protein